HETSIWYSRRSISSQTDSNKRLTQLLCRRAFSSCHRSSLVNLSPDHCEFRVDRGEVMLLTQAFEECIELRRIGRARRSHPFWDRARRRIDKFPRMDQEYAWIR